MRALCRSKHVPSPPPKKCWTIFRICCGRRLGFRAHDCAFARMVRANQYSDYVHVFHFLLFCVAPKLSKTKVWNFRKVWIFKKFSKIFKKKSNFFKNSIFFDFAGNFNVFYLFKFLSWNSDQVVKKHLKHRRFWFPIIKSMCAHFRARCGPKSVAYKMWFFQYFSNM